MPSAVAALLLAGAVQVGRAAPPQEFIDACQDDALRVCHDEAMSRDDARISRCMRAHKNLVSKRRLAGHGQGTNGCEEGLADGVRFELTRGLPLWRFSRPLP